MNRLSALALGAFFLASACSTAPKNTSESYSRKPASVGADLTCLAVSPNARRENVVITSPFASIIHVTFQTKNGATQEYDARWKVVGPDGERHIGDVMLGDYRSKNRKAAEGTAVSTLISVRGGEIFATLDGETHVCNTPEHLGHSYVAAAGRIPDWSLCEPKAPFLMNVFINVDGVKASWGSAFMQACSGDTPYRTWEWTQNLERKLPKLVISTLGDPNKAALEDAIACRVVSLSRRDIRFFESTVVKDLQSGDVKAAAKDWIDYLVANPCPN